MQPIYLLADSQLLFLKDQNGDYYSKQMLAKVIEEGSRCAYIGSSNNNEPEYYQLFCEAMHIAGISNYRMISTGFDAQDQEFLDKADLVVLAGGDPELGLKVFKDCGMLEVLQNKYYAGATFLGVSAGAVQLGWEVVSETAEGNYTSLQGLAFLPFIVRVHATQKELDAMPALLKFSTTVKRAYEIPAGGGLIFHPDLTMEAIRKPVKEFILKEGDFTETMILPVGNKSS